MVYFLANVKFTGRRAPFPADPVGLFGGGDASFLIWLILGMLNKAR
jgi:hypothetical protein